MLLFRKRKHVLYKDYGYSLIETVICLPFFLFGLLTLSSVLTTLNKELTAKNIAAKNLSNLTWRIARSIEEDINSAPVPVTSLLRVLSNDLFQLGSFPPKSSSSIIASLRIELFPGEKTKPPTHALGISKEYLCEYGEDWTTPLNSLLFDNTCEDPLYYRPITHLHIYYVDQSDTLRLMSIKGTEVLENQPMYTGIESIVLNKDGIQIKNLSGDTAFSLIVPRVSQLTLSELITTLNFISNSEEPS